MTHNFIAQFLVTGHTITRRLVKLFSKEIILKNYESAGIINNTEETNRRQKESSTFFLIGNTLQPCRGG